MTVGENVAFPLHARHFAKNEIRERVLKALDLVGLAAHRSLRTARVRLADNQRHGNYHEVDKQSSRIQVSSFEDSPQPP